MDRFGARFSKEKYIRIDIDFETGDNVVTMIVEQEGVPVTVTGTITWESGD